MSTGATCELIIYDHEKRWKIVVDLDVQTGGLRIICAGQWVDLDRWLTVNP